MSGRQDKQHRQELRQRMMRGRSKLPRKNLPAGFTIEVSEELELFDEVNRLAAQSITEYADRWQALEYRQNLEETLGQLFDGDLQRPVRVITIAIKGPDGAIQGAATIEPYLAEEILHLDPLRAQMAAYTHRVLSTLFVNPEARGLGLGEGLLKSAVEMVRIGKGRYLEGLADDRDGSADFYRHVGAVVCAHNAGLPPRPPTNMPFGHYFGKNGHWFYIDVQDVQEGSPTSSPTG